MHIFNENAEEEANRSVVVYGPTAIYIKRFRFQSRLSRVFLLRRLFNPIATTDELDAYRFAASRFAEGGQRTIATQSASVTLCRVICCVYQGFLSREFCLITLQVRNRVPDIFAEY